MPRIYVHDFNWEYAEIENSKGENDFYYSLEVFYNFSKEDPGDGWDNLTSFNVSVATPMGIGKYLKKCVHNGLFKGNFFFNNLIIVQEDNKEDLKKFVKNSLETITGKSEKEIILKAMRLFSWEFEDDYETFNKLIS